MRAKIGSRAPEIAKKLECLMLICLPGLQVDGAARDTQRQALTENVRYAAEQAVEQGIARRMSRGAPR